MDQSCRAFLDLLAREDEILDVPGTVKLDFELGSILALLDGGPAVRVAAVDTGCFPVFANILNSRERIARAIACDPTELTARMVRASTSRTKPVIIEDAPCQQRTILARDHPDLLSLLPIPLFFEQDSGPYLTAGLVCAHEPGSGYRNASYARIKPLGNNRAFIGIAPNHHLSALAKRAVALGRPLDIAVTLGAHPAVQLASCLYLSLGDDELEHTADLLGEPLRVAQAVTVDVLVPAEAEIVIEAHLNVDRPVKEGWVNEYHGMYEDYGMGCELEIRALTHRADAICQVILPGLSSEHALLGALPIGAGLITTLRQSRIDVVDLAVTRAGGGRVDVIAAVRNLAPGAAKRAYFACWSAVSMVKRVTLVDPDIDVWDDEHVEWARISRMRWDDDILIVPDVATDRNEPMQSSGVVAKVGMDATVKPGRRKTGWDRALPPTASVRAAAERLAVIGATGRLAPCIGLRSMIEVPK